MWCLLLSGQIVIGNNLLPSDLILKAYKKGCEEVLNLYKANGFLQATIKVKSDTILVYEGPQFRVGHVSLSGNQAFKDLELLAEFRGGVFNESKFMEDIDRIVRKYENSGYPFCTVKIDSFELTHPDAQNFTDTELVVNTDSVNVWLQIFEGPFIRIGDIKIDGNKFTKDYVILREIRIKRGDTFCEYKVQEATERINRLEFVELVESNLANQDELHICVKEKPASHVDGVVGYGKPGFMGAIELEILNLIGTGRAVSCNWQKLDTTSTFFEFKYKEPWVLGYPVNLVGSFSHRAELSYIKNRAELLLDIPLTLSLTINAGMSGTWVSRISRYREILGVDFNTCHIPGIYYRAKSEWDVYKLEEIMLNLDNWVGSSIPTIVLFLSANFGAILRGEVEIYDKIKLGGARTLRGYWEEEFSGAKVGWLNIEVQKSIGRGLINQAPTVFPFYDIGYVDGDIKHSFGFGGAANSPIGIIKIVYGLPKGSRFMEGKIHISIKTTF